MVVDASVLLAVLFEEPQYQSYQKIIIGGRVSVVNVAEVIGICGQRGNDTDIVDWLDQHLVETLCPGLKCAQMAGLLYATHRGRLSLGDCFCLAHGVEANAPVLTADRQWAEIDLGLNLDIQLIR